jgi:hypothetical protein
MTSALRWCHRRRLPLCHPFPVHIRGWQTRKFGHCRKFGHLQRHLLNMTHPLRWSGSRRGEARQCGATRIASSLWVPFSCTPPSPLWFWKRGRARHVAARCCANA